MPQRTTLRTTLHYAPLRLEPIDPCNVQRATCHIDEHAKRTERANAQLRLQLLDPRGLRLDDAPQLGARPGVACAAVP